MAVLELGPCWQTIAASILYRAKKDLSRATYPQPMSEAETPPIPGPPSIEERLLEQPRLDMDLTHFAVVTGLTDSGYEPLSHADHEDVRHLVRAAYRARRKRLSQNQKMAELRITNALLGAYNEDPQIENVEQFVSSIPFNQTYIRPNFGIVSALYFNSVLAFYDLPTVSLKVSKTHREAFSKLGGYSVEPAELRSALFSRMQYRGILLNV